MCFLWFEPSRAHYVRVLCSWLRVKTTCSSSLNDATRNRFILRGGRSVRPPKRLKTSRLVCKSPSTSSVSSKPQTTLTSLERVDAVFLLAGQDDHRPAELATSGHLLTTEHDGLNPHRNHSTSQNIRSCAATQSGRHNVTSEDGSPRVTAGKQSQQGGVNRPGHSGTVKLTDPGLWLNLLAAVKHPDLVGSGSSVSFGWFTL